MLCIFEIIAYLLLLDAYFIVNFLAFWRLTKAAIFMKSIFPAESMKLGTLPPPLPASSPAPSPAKPWAGNPKGNPGKAMFCPGIGNPAVMKLAGQEPKGEPLASPSSPSPESLEDVPLAG